MTFPALNISKNKWNDKDLMDYIIFDEYIYKKDDSLFNELYRNQLFCNCDGKIYKAIRKEEVTQKWRIWLSFIPNVWKAKIYFRYTNEKMELEMLRKYMVERIKDLDKSDFNEEWKSNILKSKNHAEMIFDII